MIMKRVIYSIYVDVPAKEHYGKSKHRQDTTKKASITVNAFKEHYKKLVDFKRNYANNIGATFMMFEYDLRYQSFEQKLLKICPELTGYEIVNFYKIHLLCELAKEYDEILYLDFDAVPVTKDSFFNAWNLSKGICVYNNNAMINKNNWPITKLDYGIRSPTGKYYNCQAMLIENGLDPNNDVINTGIIGARKEDVIKLDFFGGFKDTIDLMTKLRNDNTGLYPQNIINMFRYDNETIFSYKIEVNNINIQWLDTQWHYFFDKQFIIPKETKIVHAVCKKFDTIWRFCEKHNL